MKLSTSQEQINNELVNACKDNNLEFVKYLLTTSDFTYSPSIYYKEFKAFRKSCAHGNLKVVDFLLTSPDLKENVPFAYGDKKITGLIEACQFGRTEVVKYLTQSSHIKDHINIYGDEYFITASVNKKYEIVHYFLYDLNFQIGKPLEAMLKASHQIDIISPMVQTRDLFFKIGAQLNIKDDPKNKSNLKI